ncbi:hypothetical protein ALC60_10101, partial [Trachymyrmex zeteki]
FIWPDKAVLLLIEMYREKEVEFSSGFKCSNKIWVEIAAEMNETNPIYDITAQQCSSKMSGLKRTYKNIVDLNKKSGNNKNSWAFFFVCFITHTHTQIYMDIIFDALSLSCIRQWIHYLATKLLLGLLRLPQVKVH